MRLLDRVVAAGALAQAKLRLADSKTGARAVSLSPPAVELLVALPRLPGEP